MHLTQRSYKYKQEIGQGDLHDQGGANTVHLIHNQRSYKYKQEVGQRDLHDQGGANTVHLTQIKFREKFVLFS